MSTMFAMRRANGDWFAFDDRGGWRVPVFHSSRDAMLARTRNQGMLLFQPVALDGPAVADMAAGGDGGAVSFWLVAASDTDVSRGNLIAHAQLSRLVDDADARMPSGDEV
jgi:hypothetical protein